MICHCRFGPPVTRAATPPSPWSTRPNTGRQATSDSLTESLQRYMGKSHNLRQTIKEEGWDDATWPELHERSLEDDREKLGNEVEEALINLNDKADMQDRWNDFEH